MPGVTSVPPRRGLGPLARLRAVPERAWARAGFALLCVGAAIGYLVYPTYPNYDSAYSLIWGRELLDGSLPSFDAYRAPTEHPLAVAVAAVLSPLGDAAPRTWLAITVVAFCLLVAGTYRLGRAAFGPWVGAVAALLVLSPAGLRVPGRPRLRRRALPGARRLGRGAGDRAAAPRRASSGSCSRWPGSCVPRPGSCSAPTGSGAPGRPCVRASRYASGVPGRPGRCHRPHSASRDD